MAEYTPVPSRAWSSVVFAVNGDGTGTFWANTMLPWWNRFHTVAYYLVDGATIPASGASLNSQGSGADTADGFSLLGWSGHGSLSASNGHVALSAVADTASAALPKAGGTMTGNVAMGGTAVITYNNRAVSRPCRTPWIIAYNGTPEWLIDDAGVPYQNLSVAGAQVVLKEIDVPLGDDIDGATVYGSFDGVHGTYPPSQFPQLEVIKVDSDGAETVLGSISDAPASQAAYRSSHAIELSFASETISSGFSYRIRVTGENEQIGFRVTEAVVSIVAKGVAVGG